MLKLTAILFLPLLALAAPKIQDADIKSNAAIQFSKMQSLTSSRAACTDGSGVVSACTMPSSYLDATSSIQAQLDGKQAAGSYLTAITGDVVAAGPGSATATIQSNAVTTAKIADANVTAAKLATSAVDLTSSVVTNVLPRSKGGTGQTTANAALNAFLPTQTGNAAKFLATNGTDTSWQGPSGFGYTPTTSANWLSVPTNAQQALDNLAAQRPVINLMKDATAWTPSIVGLTASSLNCVYWRAGNILNGNCRFGVSSGTGSTFQLPLPSGLTVTSSYTGGSHVVGGWSIDTGASVELPVLASGGDGYIKLGIQNASNAGLSAIAGSAVTGSGASNVSITFSVPVNEWAQSVTADIFEVGDYGPRNHHPTFTALGSVSPPADKECVESKEGKFLFVDCKFTVGTASASEARVSLPNGLVPDVASIRQVGELAMGHTDGDSYYVLVEPGNSYMTFSKQGASNTGLSKLNGNNLWDNSVVQIRARIPIVGWSTFPIGLAGTGGYWMGSVIASGSSAAWGTASTSLATFSAASGTAYATEGQALAPSTNIPAIRFASLPPGRYRIVAKGLIGHNSLGGGGNFLFNDGTNDLGVSNSVLGGSGALYTPVVESSVTYLTTQTNVTFQLKASAGSGSGQAQVYGTNANPLQIEVFRYGIAP